jgi:hypothetical protein
MHHSHATLTVTSLPSASYLTWGSVLETSRLRLCGQTEAPLAGICGTRGRLGRNPHGRPRRRVEPRISLAPADRTGASRGQGAVRARADSPSRGEKWLRAQSSGAASRKKVSSDGALIAPIVVVRLDHALRHDRHGACAVHSVQFGDV